MPGATDETHQTQNSSEFFESIGDRVANLDSANGADGEEEQKAVEEIESLCMNCHENVS